MICRFCGKEGQGLLFNKWVKPTFTDHDKLQPGDIVCKDCLFWFNEASPELAAIVGKEKPQRMRNYSHFIINGQWLPLSKGDKARMKAILLTPPFPELAVIASSGQKHLAFRAMRNPPGQPAGWLQFEERRLWLEPPHLAALLSPIETLLVTFSKTRIEAGQYQNYLILQFGFAKWKRLEDQLRLHRGSLLFALALFLAQKPETESEKQPTVRTGKPGQQLSFM